MWRSCSVIHSQLIVRIRVKSDVRIREPYMDRLEDLDFGPPKRYKSVRHVTICHINLVCKAWRNILLSNAAQYYPLLWKLRFVPCLIFICLLIF
jgi:hypothetical protein